MNMKRSGERKVVLIISLSPFIASLAMPALEFRQHPPVRRLTTLLWGWWGVLTGDFPWFANATYFAGTIIRVPEAASRGHSLLRDRLGIGEPGLRTVRGSLEESPASTIRSILSRPNQIRPSQFVRPYLDLVRWSELASPWRLKVLS